jgi:hypothetical protein
VDEIEWRISLKLYGPEEKEDAHVDEAKTSNPLTTGIQEQPEIGMQKERSDSLILKPKEHLTARRDDRSPRPKQSKNLLMRMKSFHVVTLLVTPQS